MPSVLKTERITPHHLTAFSLMGSLMGRKQKRPEWGVFAVLLAEKESASVELFAVSQSITMPENPFKYR